MLLCFGDRLGLTLQEFRTIFRYKQALRSWFFMTQKFMQPGSVGRVGENPGNEVASV